MRTGSLRLPLLILAVMAAGGVVLVFTSRGQDDGDTSADQTKPARTAEVKLPPDPESEPEPGVPQLPKSTCPADLTNCTVASGRVIYVEKVDPDGDGDAHFVTASTESVTAPGLTIFDVRTDLRPNPLPGIGDLVGGAGPVYPGHAGQKQIQVTEFNVAKSE